MHHVQWPKSSAHCGSGTPLFFPAEPFDTCNRYEEDHNNSTFTSLPLLLPHIYANQSQLASQQLSKVSAPVHDENISIHTKSHHLSHRIRSLINAERLHLQRKHPIEAHAMPFPVDPSLFYASQRLFTDAQPRISVCIKLNASHNTAVFSAPGACSSFTFRVILAFTSHTDRNELYIPSSLGARSCSFRPTCVQLMQQVLRSRGLSEHDALMQ